MQIKKFDKFKNPESLKFKDDVRHIFEDLDIDYMRVYNAYIINPYISEEFDIKSDDYSIYLEEDGKVTFGNVPQKIGGVEISPDKAHKIPGFVYDAVYFTDDIGYEYNHTNPVKPEFDNHLFDEFVVSAIANYEKECLAGYMKHIEEKRGILDGIRRILKLDPNIVIKTDGESQSDLNGIVVIFT